ncbi:MAG: hypothetical protein ACRC44_08545 [Bifidobacterium asteroides]
MSDDSERLKFDVCYIFRVVDLVDGKQQRIFNKERLRDRSTVALTRYVDEKFSDAVRAYSYWTDVAPDHRFIAGEATGIGDLDCLWRIEWSFPLDQVTALIEDGELRFSRAGTYTEYFNREPVPLSNVTWHRMNEV